MKRRTFLAGTALFSLFSGEVFAQKKPAAKKPPAKAVPKNSKTSKKSNQKSNKPTRKPLNTSASETLDASTEANITPKKNAIALPNTPDEWKTCELTTQLEINNVRGAKKLWLPLPQYEGSIWQRSQGFSWRGNFQKAAVLRDPIYNMEIFYAEWDGNNNAELAIVAEIATQNRHFDINRRTGFAERGDILRANLQGSDLLPIDGIVQSTAENAIGRIKDPLAQAKALYDWVIDNVSFNANAKETGELSVMDLLSNARPIGSTTDIVFVLVALCRAMGIPARPVFGLRVDRSRLFPSLSATGDLTRSFHCRAEIYSPGYGWIPVDPAAVKKVVSEDNLSTSDARFNVLKKLLFGFWERNWVAFNTSQNVRLRESTRNTALPFLYQPIVETASERIIGTDSGNIKMQIKARIFEG